MRARDTERRVRDKSEGEKREGGIGTGRVIKITTKGELEYSGIYWD